MADSFDDVPVSRRRFAQLAAATAGALSVGGSATASTPAPTHEAFDDEYAFAQANTPAEYAVPTLVRVSEAAGLSAVESAAGETITTTDPEPAAYARLTAPQAVAVADLPTAETLSHSPGSNPFWRLGYYPLGVFPEPRRSTGFVDYEQMVDGLEHLAAEHDDRMNFYSIGDSPGHVNEATGREDPKDIYVAEVTNDVDDEEAFEEKTKVLYSLSLHGLERAGAEAGSRFIEGLLRGTETATEALLDDVVLVFAYTNPDGWVAKHPQYDSGGQFLGPTGVPVVPQYERGTAEVYDSNRHYPAVGWIPPGHYPAEPRGRDYESDGAGVDRDVPERTATNAPDALAIVEHLRSYENLEYGTDMHGALNSSNFVEGLIGQGKFDHGGFHELYQMCRVIDEDLETALEAWTTAGDLKDTVAGDANVAPLGFGTLPEQAFDYAAVWDTIGYSGSGFMGDWLPQPEPVGLGLTSLDFEMAYSNAVGSNVYDPELVEMQVTGYRAAIRTLAEYATREVTARVETGGERTAYVTTDALARSSDDLDFGRTTTGGSQRSGTLAAEGASFTESVSGVDELAVHPHVRAAQVSARLVDPSGETVRTFAPDSGKRGARCCGMPEWAVTDPADGEWTVELDGVDAPTAATVAFTTLAVAGGTNPDPVEALGYEQRDYEVTPFAFFEEFEAFADGEFDPVTVEDVKRGALDGYDNCVVIHDEGASDGDYTDALADFAASGGDLLLTDAGVTLLPAVSSVASGSVSRETFYIANVTERNEDHPLLADTRPIQRELWKIQPLGYNESEEAPMYLVDPDALSSAGGTSAGTTSGQSPAGTVSTGDGEVSFVGGLLPPANQSHLHPFGLLDYCVSFLGHTMFANALGFEQVREVDGEEVKRFGPDG